MEVDNPIWRLKIACPCCGQGRPMLVTCPACAHVAAWCDEVGNAFLDPRDLVGSLSADLTAKCPSCGTRGLDEFVLASSQQIRRAGLEGLYD